MGKGKKTKNQGIISTFLLFFFTKKTLHFRSYPLRSRQGVILVVQVRGQDEDAAVADVVPVVADDLDLARGDGSYGVALVWVAKDEDYCKNEGRLDIEYT